MIDILIVEDNKELSDILCDFLRADNYTVSTAESGEKALSLYEKYGDDLYNTDSDFIIREINSELYRFDYRADMKSDKRSVIFTVNIILGIMSAIIIGVLIFIRVEILSPFETLTEVPYELSKGNLTAPVKETKN